MRAALLLVVVPAAALVLVPSAGAAQRLTTIETLSRNVDPKRVRLDGSEPMGKLQARVLLPDGYDGRRRFPVLYLLHGVGDNFSTWSKPANGDILNSLRGLPAVVVMPEAGRGFYTNWWNGGRRGDPGWERYYLDELIPRIERRYRLLPGRRNRAVAGASMGGFGAARLAGQAPGYFGAAAVFSGYVQHQRPEVEAGLRVANEVEYGDIFGPMDGFYATGHNPTRLAANLRHSRLFVTVGDGTAEPGVDSSPAAILGGGAVEAGLRQQNEEFVAALRSEGVPTTYSPRAGVHDWPYWRSHLRAAVAFGLFEPVDERPASWSYTTVAQTGRAWNLDYRFAAAPDRLIIFERDDGTLTARGTGRVRIENEAGCSFTADLPFSRAMPAHICGWLAVRVSPRRIPVGRRRTVRFRVVRVAGSKLFPVAGARVRFAGKRAVTSSSGRARVRVELRRPGVRRARVTASGLRTVRPRLRAVRRSGQRRAKRAELR